MLATQLFTLIMTLTAETLENTEENCDALVCDRKASWIQHRPQHLLVDDRGGYWSTWT